MKLVNAPYMVGNKTVIDGASVVLDKTDALCIHPLVVALETLDLTEDGMGVSVEILLEAQKHGLWVREVAVEFGLEVRGCLGLLVEAVRRKLVSAKEAKQDAKKLIDEGYRISEEVLKEFYILLRSEESK